VGLSGGFPNLSVEDDAGSIVRVTKEYEDRGDLPAFNRQGRCSGLSEP